MSFPEKLYRCKEWLQLIIDASPAGLVITNADGIIQFVNPAAENMFRYAAAELVGHSVDRLLPRGHRARHKKYVKKFVASPKTRAMGSDRDLYGCRKDGSVFSADVSLHPIELDGEFFVLANVLDVTERRRQLINCENRMRFLVENLPAGAVYLENDLLYFNPVVEGLIGYQVGEIQTVQEWFQVLCGDDHAAALAKYNAVKEDGFHQEWVLSVSCKDFVKRELRIAGHQYDQHEVWLVADISELHEAQAKLVQAERLAAIGQMVTGLAHESRNALQRARGCLDLLELDLEDREEQLDLIVRIRRALGDLQHNYEEVRQYAAPIILRHDVCCLSSLIELAFDHLLCEFPGGTHKIVFEPYDKSEIVCDSHRMMQVFRNLIENAMSAKPSGVTIRVVMTDVVFQNQCMRHIELADDGVGMAETTFARTFEPFFTTKQTGTGLGLPICQRILDAHGGMISIRSVLQSGTTVSLMIPTSR